MTKKLRLVFGLLAFLFLAISCQGLARVSADSLSQEDLDAIYGNWPTWVPDNGSSGCGSTTLTGNTNGVQAYNYFTGKGLNPAAAAGIVGNMTEESIGVDPERAQGYYDTDYTADSSVVQFGLNNPTFGWGIVQWTPPSKIITTSEDQGITVDTIDTLSYQLDFLWNELITSYTTSTLGPLKTVPNTVAGASQAAGIFLSGFERGNPSPSREAYAIAYYQLAVNNVPLPPNVPTSSTGGGNSAASSGSDGCSTVSTSGYQNPYRDVKGLTAMRIDEGVDYGGSGPIYAIGDGTVTVADNGNADWPGGNYVSYQLSDGPDEGQYVYFAENCPLSVTVGEKVTSTTVICNLNNAYPYSESGWSLDATYNDTPAAHCAYITVPDGTATAYGYDFDKLLVSLGTPSGTWQFPSQQGGMNLAGTLPDGWPSSAAALSAPGVLSC